MQDLLEFALTIAREAGALTLRHFRSADLVVDRKGDDTPVTVADRAAEALLRERIRAAYPDDAIVGEEHDDVAGTSSRTWYLDPIDGTSAFVHGVPLYTNLVACHDPDGPLLGVVNTPALGEATWAGRGFGCFHQDAPARVSTVDDLSQALVTTSGVDYWPAPLRARAADPPFMLRTWGDGYGYTLVATGRVDAMVDPSAAIWDLAPLPVLLAEAGGRFTSLTGEDGATHGSAVGSNGHLHTALLDYFA